MSLVSSCTARFPTAKFNFTIDHILNVAGKKCSLESFRLPEEPSDNQEKFDWLKCTRYKPPKLPRQRKREGIQPKKLGRSPRIPFSSSQVAFLEAKFLRTPYLSSSDVVQLASCLKLSETRVKIWFQNRRAREKRDREFKEKSLETAAECVETRHQTLEKTVQRETSSSLFFWRRQVENEPAICLNLPGPERNLEPTIPLDLSESHAVCRAK